MAPRIECLVGPAIKPAMQDLAKLRIAVFREWPYLYDGSDDYERAYFARFAESKDALVVVAADGDQIVGAATATHLGGHAAEFKQHFVEAGLESDAICYFGESVLLPAYRGQGIGHAFFDAREDHARSKGRFTHTAFCSVVRPANHPLKPRGYRPLDPFWRKRGYAPVPGLAGSLAWLDLGEAAETQKSMQYWMRAL